MAAGCDAPRAETPSVFLESDFPCLDESGASSAPARSDPVPSVVPGTVSAGAPPGSAWSGPGKSDPPVCSVGLGAPASGVLHSVVAEVHLQPVASVRSLDAAVGVMPASPAAGCLLPEAAGVVLCVPSPLPSASSPLSIPALIPSSPSVVSSPSGLSTPAPAMSSGLVAPCVLECALPPAGPALPPASISGCGGGLLPRAVEASVLRGRATSVLGPPATGSSGGPLAGGHSSDDQQPHVKRHRSARAESPRRSWVEDRDAMEDEGVDVAVPSSVVSSVVEVVSPASGFPSCAVAPGDRDLVVILSKDWSCGASAPVPVGGGPAASVEGLLHGARCGA
ncbi:uncharacterized protein [Procambarus clarkii]|uniref:uncharacterized protein n=1 Tax=Procambarus clarkii TaxID=6728 RepID=UPI003742D005